MWRILVLVLVPFVVLAGTAVPPSVSSVSSGGYWEYGGSSGTYRVVVVNSGYEHVTSRVFVEWLRDASRGDEGPSVEAVVEPVLPFGRDVASLDAAIQPVSSGKVRIVISGVRSVQPKNKVRVVLTATTPGQVTR